MTKKKRVRRTKEQIERDNAMKVKSINAPDALDMLAGTPTEGLGDKVEKVLEATGISKIAKFLMGDDCNCEERKKKLNLIGWGKVNCLNEEEYNYLHAFFESNPTVVQPTQQIELVKIARRVFNRRFETSGCAGCVRDLVNRLRTVYETYEAEV